MRVSYLGISYDKDMGLEGDANVKCSGPMLQIASILGA